MCYGLKNKKIKNFKIFLKKYLTNAKRCGNIAKSSDGDTIVGVDCGEGPPVPIPNTEVKLACAKDTWREAARENR